MPALQPVPPNCCAGPTPRRSSGSPTPRPRRTASSSRPAPTRRQITETARAAGQAATAALVAEQKLPPFARAMRRDGSGRPGRQSTSNGGGAPPRPCSGCVTNADTRAARATAARRLGGRSAPTHGSTTDPAGGIVARRCNRQIDLSLPAIAARRIGSARRRSRGPVVVNPLTRPHRCG